MAEHNVMNCLCSHLAGLNFESWRVLGFSGISVLVSEVKLSTS